MTVNKTVKEPGVDLPTWTTVEFVTIILETTVCKIAQVFGVDQLMKIIAVFAMTTRPTTACRIVKAPGADLPI
jgi:hypothetical protein